MASSDIWSQTTASHRAMNCTQEFADIISEYFANSKEHDCNANILSEAESGESKNLHFDEEQEDDNGAEGDVHFPLVHTDIDSKVLAKLCGSADLADNAGELDTKNQPPFTCRCQCHYGKPCSLRYTQSLLRDLQASRRGLSREELDLVVLSQLEAGLVEGATAQCGQQNGQAERTKNRVRYFHKGERICSQTFLFIHGIVRDRLRSLLSRYQEHGTVARALGDRKHTAHDALTRQQRLDVVRFLSNFAEQHSIPYPGRVSGHPRGDCKLLPASCTPSHVYGIYVDSCNAAQAELIVGHSAFCRLWRECLPGVVALSSVADCRTCGQHGGFSTEVCSIPVEEGRLKEMETALEHVKDTIEELEYYWTVVQNAKDIFQRSVARRELSPGLMKPGHSVPDCGADITAHYSFHFAQQLHYPSNPQQPGPVYFKTPRRCGLFAVMAEALPQTALFLLDEATETGRGADTVISILDFFFQNLGLKEKKVHLHAYNCAGHSRSSTLIQYLLWRVMTERHAEIKLSLLTGSTKLSLDWCIGLFKHKFRRSKVDCLEDIAKVALQASSQEVFVPQLCATEDGHPLVPLRDWTGYLDTWFRKLGDLKKYHHFTFRRSGKVYLQLTCKSGQEVVPLLKGSEVPPRGQTAPIIQPPGLSRQRAEYLYREIREFVAPEYRDRVCPQPSAAPSSVSSTSVRAGRAASAASNTSSSNASAAASRTTSTAAAAPSVSRKAGGSEEKRPRGFTAGKASQKPAFQTCTTQSSWKKGTRPPTLANQRAAVPNTQKNQTGKQAVPARPQQSLFTKAGTLERKTTVKKDKLGAPIRSKITAGSKMLAKYDDTLRYPGLGTGWSKSGYSPQGIEPARTKAIKTAGTSKGRQLTTQAKGKKAVTVECARYITREDREKASHTCNRQCVKESEKDLYKYISKNPLRLPLLCGWQRKAYNAQAGYKRELVYRTPCGRYLQSIEEVDEFLSITDSQLYIDHFCFDIFLDVNETFVPGKVLFQMKDISAGRERVPISCVNSIDAQGPDGVEYCSFRIPAEGVDIPLDESFLQCCDCADNCRDRSKCACQQLIIENTTWIGRKDPTAGYHHRRLKERIFTGVVECNSLCQCDSRCRNRVVQNGLSCRLQVFKTEKCGWGLRCLDNLPKGGFICIYAGQVLTENGANVHGTQFGDDYLADLDFIVAVEEAKEYYESHVKEPDHSTSGGTGRAKEKEKDHSDDPVHDMARPSDRTTEEKNGDHRTGMEKVNISWEKEGGGRRVSEPMETDTPPHWVQPDLLRTREETQSVPAAKQTIQKDKKEEAEQKRRRGGRWSLSHYTSSSMYILDAVRTGNVGRYLNHSCSPNVFVQNVFVDSHDLRFPWVAFFAQQSIPAGTELRWDYKYKVNSVPGKMLFCRCGSPNCRTRLL